jgi:hypothetical protein
LGVKGCGIFITDTETSGLKLAGTYCIGQNFFSECCMCFVKKIFEKFRLYGTLNIEESVHITVLSLNWEIQVGNRAFS